MGIIFKVQRSRGNSTIWPIVSVRAFEFESFSGLYSLLPSSTDSNVIVWVTACLGTKQYRMQKNMLVLHNMTNRLKAHQVPLPAPRKDLDKQDETLCAQESKHGFGSWSSTVQELRPQLVDEWRDELGEKVERSRTIY